MKVGDLVRCIWQPGTTSYDPVKKCVLPMTYTIKGELGLIVGIFYPRRWERNATPLYRIAFPQFGGYTHELSHRAFEVLKQ